LSKEQHPSRKDGSKLTVFQKMEYVYWDKLQGVRASYIQRKPNQNNPQSSARNGGESQDGTVAKGEGGIFERKKVSGFKVAIGGASGNGPRENTVTACNLSQGYGPAGASTSPLKEQCFYDKISATEVEQYKTRGFGSTKTDRSQNGRHAKIHRSKNPAGHTSTASWQHACEWFSTTSIKSKIDVENSGRPKWEQNASETITKQDPCSQLRKRR